MILFSCPSCNAKMNARPSFAGRKIRCPSCSQKIIVPAPPAPQNRTVLGRLDPPPVPAASFAAAPAPQYAPPAYDDEREAAAFRRRRARQGYLVVGAIVGVLAAIVVGVWLAAPRRPGREADQLAPDGRRDTKQQLTDKQREAALAALRQLGKLEAALEVGVAYAAFNQLAIEAKAVVNEAEAALPPGDLRSRLKAAIAAYADSTLVWHHKIRYSSLGVNAKYGHGELIERYSLPINSEGQCDFDVALQLIWAAARKNLSAARALTS